MRLALWLLAFAAGTGAIVWGAEAFAEHLGQAALQLGVGSFALALLLAGAEPEDLATVIAASLRGSPRIALGDVIGANVTICLVALGVGAVIAPLPFRAAVMRYALLGLPLGTIGAWLASDGQVSRREGATLVALYVLYVAAIWWAERSRPHWARSAVWRKPARRRLPGVPRRLGAIWRSCWPGSWRWQAGPRCW